MTETAKIAANNSLQRQLAEADAAYEGSVADLKHYVASEKDAAADKLYEREWAEDQRTYERKWAEDQKAAAEQESVYNTLKSAMQNGDYTTVADLERYLFGAEGQADFDESDAGYGLTPVQKADLLNMYNTIKNDPKQQEADKEFNKTDAQRLFVSALKVSDDDVEGIEADDDWISIETDGEDIDVDTVGKAPVETRDRILRLMNEDQKTNGTVLYFDGSYYVYVEGELYGIKNEDDLGKILDNERRRLPLRDGVE